MSEQEGAGTSTAAAVVSSKLERLKKLRGLKKDAEKRNKATLVQEYRHQKIKSLSSKKKPDHADVEASASHADADPVSERERNLNYSIDDCEKWDSKRTSHPNHKGGYLNMNKLADLSYKKEITELEVDSQEYDRQKALLHNQDFAHRPTPEAIDSLVTGLESSNERRMKRKRTQKEENGVDSFINEKNKQFNLKLNRQYGS